MTQRRNIYFLIFTISLVFVVLVLLHDFLQNKIISYGYLDRFFLINGIFLVLIILLLLVFGMCSFYEKSKISKSKVLIFKGLLLILFIIVVITSSLSIPTVHNLDIHRQDSTDEWAIGIYSSNSNEPLSFSENNIQNPVLTYKDIKDFPSVFVADPFLIQANNKYFLFFEVMKEKNSEGDIGLATSKDGYNWSYDRIVLDEPFNLSYPCVFKWKDDYYMIPETGEINEVRLYKAKDFPYNWSYDITLIKGDFVDNTIFCYNDIWWIFTFTPTFSELRLYYSDDLSGPWIEHPKSPIIKGDLNISRPGGNVAISDGRIIRYAQDDYPYYGEQVWAFEITKLSKNTYEEHKVGDVPVIKGHNSWNKDGMHQVSPYKVNDSTWIAAVDGKVIKSLNHKT